MREQLSSAVTEQGLVDGRIYVDPAIFDREMERIFGRVWIYIGHESQVSLPGDFFRTRIGRHELLVTRDSEGAIRAFENRCPHRGSLICAERQGNQARFTCPYHAWTFRSDGKLVGVPHRAGYGEGFKDRVGGLGLRPVARLDQYRGFLFASLAAEGESLADYLGDDVRAAFDNFVDRSPEGRLELVPGRLVQTFNANWKLQIENSIDMVHPPILHANAVAASEAFVRGLQPEDPLPVAVDVFRSNGLSFAAWDEVTQYALRNGHCYMKGFLQKADNSELPMDDHDAAFGSDDQMQFASQAQYKAAMVQAYGLERAEEILAFSRHNTIIYPNLFINPRLQQLRYLHPVAVDRTEQHCFVFRLVGAPPEAAHVAIEFLTASNSPSSIVTTDDHEIFERVQQGLAASLEPVVDLTRGVGEEVPADGGFAAPGTNELAMRNQHRAWAALMGVE